MKKRALHKDFFMEIKKSLTRFLSILFIVAMGVAFYSGIQSAAPSMRYTGDAYFDASHLMDLKVISTLGLKEKDLQELEDVKGIKKAEGGYLTDTLSGSDTQQQVVRVESILPTLNRLTVTEGRLPKAEGECFLDEEFLKLNDYKVGDTIELKEGQDATKILKTEAYTIVGTGNSPAYLSFSRGNSTLGSGEVSGYAYLSEESFDQDIYMVAYLEASGSKELTAYTEDYDNLMDRITKEIEGISGVQCERRYQEVKEEAGEKLAEAETELNDGKKEAQDKLDEAQEKLDDADEQLADGKQKIEDGKKELADNKELLEEKELELEDSKTKLDEGWEQIRDARATLDVNNAEFLSQKSITEQQLTDGETAIAEGKEKLQEGKNQLEAGEQQLTDGWNDYQTGKQQWESGKAEYETNAAILKQSREQLEQQESQLKTAKDSLAQLDMLIAGGMATQEQIVQAETLRSTLAVQEPALAQARIDLEDGEQELANGKIPLDNSETQLKAAKEKLDEESDKLETAKTELASQEAVLTEKEQEITDGWTQLNSAAQQISEGYAQLGEQETALVDAQTKIEDGEVQLKDAKTEIEKAEKELEDGESEIKENEQKLTDAKKEYEDAKKEAEEKIADGEQELADAKKDIEDIAFPEWTVSDRSSLPENTSYGENADRIRNIGQVFPVLFFLVAALISLTTMTRMVEEQRTQIGTLKALGYSKWSIAGKYLNYALLATLGGSLLGVLIGEKILPYIIITAYGIMYHHIPELVIPYNVNYALIATGTAVFCTMVATFSACFKELSATPAVLMRPPAPKEGKRVLLERVTFLWKHLSFTWKSTVRNLFRYKKRFLMTIFGIGGCMALLLVGYGMKDSIMDIAVLQYKEIQTYDGIVLTDDEATPEEREELTQAMAKEVGVKEQESVIFQKVTVKVGKKDMGLYLYVPEDIREVEKFVNFRNRVTKETYTMDDEGVILTEKMANMLDLSVGDMLYIEDEERGRLEVKVSAICENYMVHYAYMSPALYEKVYKEKPEYNSIMFSLEPEYKEKSESVGESILTNKAALSISYTASLQQQLDDMLATLDTVIWVLIISAGMLAFVVLYNLNNININERKRELATIKVLGFYDNEVSAYVYRENILLTFFGILLGIVMGIILHRFVIVTVEVDACMFGRNINWASFLYSILFTCGFSIFVNAIMYYKLKKIDMVESLKSVE